MSLATSVYHHAPYKRLRGRHCLLWLTILATLGCGAEQTTPSPARNQEHSPRPELLASTQSLTSGSGFSVADLPTYAPEVQVSGTIRSYGFGFGGILVKWQEEFKRFHPGIRFENTLPTSDAAFPALITYFTLKYFSPGFAWEHRSRLRQQFHFKFNSISLTCNP